MVCLKVILLSLCMGEHFCKLDQEETDLKVSIYRKSNYINGMILVKSGFINIDTCTLNWINK